MSCSELNKCKDCENGEDINKPSICSPKRFYRYKLKDYKKIWGLAEITKSKNGLGEFFNTIKDTYSAMICPFRHSSKLFEFTNWNFDELFNDSSNLDYRIWVNITGYHKS